MKTHDAGAVRAHLIDALEADLVGPFGKPSGAPVSDAPERLRNPPSRWYLTGFLVPLDQGVIEDEPDDEEDDLAAGSDEDNEEAARHDPTVKKVRRLPASMGLSVFVPSDTAQLTAHVCWADYQRVEADERKQWSRTFHQRTVTLPLNDAVLREGVALRDSLGLRLEGHVEKTPEGALAVAIFLVNARAPTSTAAERDESYAFQTHLALECAKGFVGRQDSSDAQSDDDDDLVNDLQFRHRQQWAVGHGVSVRVDATSRPVTRVETDWLPRVEVLPVEARWIPEVTVRMEQLAAFTKPSEAVAALSPLVRTYRDWITTQAAIDVGSARREETRDELVRRAHRAATRIEEGIQLLEREPLAFDAFRWMNSVMAQAERKARPDDPKWRLFQLAFILLNLPSVEDEAHADRELVELIFFPTGGGKTQAYLGLIAFTLLLRRLRGQSQPHRGLGVAVLLRYTLRLLTLDQLGRAATLICALDVLRQQEPKRLGEVRFSIGLWVGRSATANTLEQVAAQITEYKNDNSPRAQSPFPLATCPWCATPFERECFILQPSKSRPQEVLVGCANIACVFNLGRNPEGLPVLFVDEQIYRELPCFLVATVDKFAMLPWRGETGLLFGRALGRTGKRFVGPCDDAAAVKAALVMLPNGLRPPELIVQDELHLISGPLGSMVGLYEGAILTLAPRAKLVASTATVRRSRHQVSRLYGRDVALFPPPGVDASEMFFASVGKEGARQYVGVAAPGRPMKAILLRVYVSVLAAAARGEHLHGAASADPYLTLVGYFNSLRELGGMRRLVEDEVRRLAMDRVRRRPEDVDKEADHPWYRGRTIRGEPIELTSREKTADIKASKNRLELAHGQPQSVDVVLASNMISVGVDIDRLGLMVVAGQPKTTSEYIQASSRVGRKANKPGLVVTCLNAAKPRDRSHYERFGTYHESFYRFVEATSVTPFSAPALDRGLAGVVVALGRLLDTAMTAPLEWKSLQTHRDALEKKLESLAKRAGRGLPKEESERASGIVMQRARSLLDSWRNIIEQAKKDAAQRAYSPYDPEGKGLKPLLRTFLDATDNLTQDELKFEAPTSMRDVESSVHLWIQRQPLGGYRAPKAAMEEVAHDEP
ncbi:DISARM system helicase DrmA [Corallococcus silvisoli]|uniref:DISARM system helicase DrmA n=1 Tax=Corallococcus silvisoli TaxID=2697031 RepID=UPI0013785E20|nr:DISARM system helicase DrmA [Corallococcus silvisoli]NBD12654.1 helicase [Corallococcus silvisoli]